MKSYDLADIINGLYEQLVHYNDNFNLNQGIYFCCQLDSQCYGYDKDGNTHHPEWEGRSMKAFHIIILNPHKVFTCTTNVTGLIHELPSVDKWKNKSNHDSCWRNVSSDELTSLMFHCHDMAYKNCPEELRPQKKSHGVRFSLKTSLCGPVFKYVEVTREPDYDLDKTGNRHKLTSIKIIDK